MELLQTLFTATDAWGALSGAAHWHGALAGLPGHLAGIAHAAGGAVDALTGGHLRFDTLAPVPTGARGSAPVGTGAAAAAAGGDMPTAFAMLKDGTFFQKIMDAVTQQAVAHAGALVGDGEIMLNLLMVMMIAWIGIKGALRQAGPNEMLSEFLELAILWGVAFWFLYYYMEVTCYVTSGFYYISDKLTSGTSTLSFSCAGATSYNPPSTGPDGRYKQLYTGLQLIFNAVNAMFTSASTNQAINGVIIALVDTLVKMFIALIMMLCGVIYFVVFAASQILIYIAISLGPVFIPFLVWPVATDYFHNWFKFMLVAGFYAIVGYLVLSFSSALTDEIQKLTNATSQASANAPWTTMALNNLALLTVAVMMCWFMTQVPKWANGILQGHARTSMPNLRAGRIAGAALGGAHGVLSGARRVGGDAPKAYRWAAGHYRDWRTRNTPTNTVAGSGGVDAQGWNFGRGWFGPKAGNDADYGEDPAAATPYRPARELGADELKAMQPANNGRRSSNMAAGYDEKTGEPNPADYGYKDGHFPDAAAADRYNADHLTWENKLAYDDWKTKVPEDYPKPTDYGFDPSTYKFASEDGQAKWRAAASAYEARASSPGTPDIKPVAARGSFKGMTSSNDGDGGPDA